jgi:hypothetical protein
MPYWHTKHGGAAWPVSRPVVAPPTRTILLGKVGFLEGEGGCEGGGGASQGAQLHLESGPALRAAGRRGGEGRGGEEASCRRGDCSCRAVTTFGLSPPVESTCPARPELTSSSSQCAASRAVARLGLLTSMLA